MRTIHRIYFSLKRYKNLWDAFISKENFELAYKNSIKGKSGQEAVRLFKENPEENLEALRQWVANGYFRTSEYTEKQIFEPKPRTIYKLPYNPDRIVQHAVMNILKPILTNLFIENSYACIEGRGQLKASIKCSEYVRHYTHCFKGDIFHFYASINQYVLSAKLHRIIDDERFMEVVDNIIFSFPGGYNCPIGNYCSQWFGNFYLTFMDNYILHTLKCGAYERYCDDFMLFSNDKEYLHQCRHDIEVFLRSKLELKYSKADVFNTKQGVDFVGYRHFKNYILVRKSTAKRLKKRVEEIRYNLDNDTGDLKRMESQLASANGLLKHANSYNLRKSLEIDELKAEIRNRILLAKAA